MTEPGPAAADLAARQALKIATFNCGTHVGRLHRLLAWFNLHEVDIVFLQETRITPHSMGSKKLAAKAGYALVAAPFAG